MKTQGEVIRLLYIDDDRGLSRLVEKELGRHGYAVTCCADGDAGLETLVARPTDFDVVALDHYMPGREGLDVLPDIIALQDPPPVKSYQQGTWGPNAIHQLVAPNAWRLPFERAWREKK